MHSRLIVAAWLTLSALSPAARAQTARTARIDPTAAARELDAYAARAVRDWGVVGLSMAVVKDGRVAFAKGYGVRELGKPAPVDTATLFAVGSTTKAMTAAALGMMVDAGKLGWDDPLTAHLPGFQMADPYVTREVTVRDALTHRAGLGNADFLWYGAEHAAPEVVRRARLVPPAYSLRSSFIYQNVMYAVAGSALAAVAGAPWEEVMRSRIFAPLGMAGTVPTLAAAAGRPNVAAPHFLFGDTARVIRNATVDAVAPAGSVWSSAADMAKWIRCMLDSGRAPDGRPLLRPGTWAELLRPQTIVTAAGFYPTARLTRPHWTTYGLGWFQHDYAGRKVDFHTGSIDGMVAIVALVPDERLGLVVLANTDHAELRHALMYRAIDLYLGNAPRDWSAELRALYAGLDARADSARRAAEARRVPGTRPSLPLEKYAGTYADSLRGSVTVTAEGGVLRLRAGAESSAATLEHWHYDAFRVRWDDAWRGTGMVTFTIGAAGEPDRMEMGGATLRRRRE